MLRTLAAALFGATLGIAVLLLQPRAVAPQAASAPHPTNAREQWAVDLLARLGNTQPSADTLAMVVEWTIAEDGGDGALARNNALNTTLCLPGRMTGAINGDGACGVQGYATWEDGIEATARTLEQQNFSAIRAALLLNDAEGARAALWASGWAASHYGYGAGWPRSAAVQSGAKCQVTDTMQVNAHFTDTSSGYWAGQAGGMHNGTDYGGNPGDPVYAPFALTVEDIQYYADPGRIGWYVQGRFDDGYLFYAGHLGATLVQVGERVEACRQIGTIGEVYHTHIKINAPGEPEPCEATGCDDFEAYWEQR